MSKKKDTVIEVVDTKTGAVVNIGKKTIAEIKESGKMFEVFANNKYLTATSTFNEALDEAIKNYNLSL